MINNKNIIDVIVVKPFNSLRCPCPPKGTKGELYDFQGKYACVRFPLPMVDNNGTVWTSHGQDTDYMSLKFLLDEIDYA